VVKNVAGFDLTRLMVGAWGTLGVITEVTVRLRPRPERDETMALAVGEDATAVARLVGALRATPLVPLAEELIDGRLAARLGLGDGPSLLVRLGGNDELVTTQRAALAALGDTAPVDPAAWRAIREEPSDAAVFRLSGRPSRIAEAWNAARRIAGSLGGSVRATVPRGVVRCVVPSPPPEALAAALRDAAFPGTTIHERLPAPLWPTLAPSPVEDRLSRRMRDAFDPHRLLNPGIFGERAP
jgi:glycolate oxidase FAD binding subunit